MWDLMDSVMFLIGNQKVDEFSVEIDSDILCIVKNR